MNALVFLYKRVLAKPLDEWIDAVRAERRVNVPVVLDMKARRPPAVASSTRLGGHSFIRYSACSPPL